MGVWFDNAVRNVIDGNGIGISVVAMMIVFLALLLISLFISALPRVLAVVAIALPEEQRAAPPVDPRFVAAIGAVLRDRKYGRQDCRLTTASPSRDGEAVPSRMS